MAKPYNNNTVMKYKTTFKIVFTREVQCRTSLLPVGYLCGLLDLGGGLTAAAAAPGLLTAGWLTPAAR